MSMALNKVSHLWRKLETAALLREARTATGLSSFGDHDPAPALERLTESLRAEASLSLFGRIAARADLRRLLEYRLQMEDAWQARPEVLHEPVTAPLFIAGLPRSGTTLLHNLLAQDKANRVPLTWEVMYPVPAPRAETCRTDARIRRVSRELRWLDRVAPEFRKIHEVGARLPQECLAITAYSFESYLFQTMYRVPAYQSWLESRQSVERYRLHKKILQHLQSQNAAQRWVLKAPAHLFALRALLRVYPDARIVQTHRDPKKIIASVCSLTQTLRGAFSRHIDEQEIGAEMAARWTRAIESAMEQRPRLENDRNFFDMTYEEFVGAPLQMIERLYDHFGIRLDTAARQAMARFLEKNPQSKHGRHRYSLSRFGVDSAEIDRHFKDYRERFGIRRETAD